MAFVAPAPGRVSPVGAAAGASSTPCGGGAPVARAGGSLFFGLPHRRIGVVRAGDGTAVLAPRAVAASTGDLRMAVGGDRGGRGSKPPRPGAAGGGGNDYATFDALLNPTIIDADAAAAAAAGGGGTADSDDVAADAAAKKRSESAAAYAAFASLLGGGTPLQRRMKVPKAYQDRPDITPPADAAAADASAAADAGAAAADAGAAAAMVPRLARPPIRPTPAKSSAAAAAAAAAGTADGALTGNMSPARWQVRGSYPLLTRPLPSALGDVLPFPLATTHVQPKHTAMSVMAPAGGFRALAAAAATVGMVVACLAGVSSVTTAAQVPRPFPAPLPVRCDHCPRVRKEAGSLTAAEWATYQRAVLGLHQRETSDKRETLDWFERFIEMHHEYAKGAHNGAHFLAWHRLFLLAYENALRTVEPGVTIPYWDWSMDAGALEMAPVWNASRLGRAKKNLPIEGGAFEKFHVDTGPQGPHYISRGFQSQERNSMRRLPLVLGDKATLRALWSNKDMDFPKFSRALETEHALLHVAVGGFSGDMVILAKAAGDVVFWSHHAYIDYVWSRRQEHFPSEQYVGQQGGRQISMDDILAPFNTQVRYAVELTCVKYIADPRETRPPLSVVNDGIAAKAVNSAWLPCSRDSDCGCGSCVNNACVIGTAARTTAKCGAVSKCIRHPNPTIRQLVCRCLDTEKCQCTRSADCGCGVCRRSDGTCHAPLAVRLEAYCGPGSQCVKSCPTSRAFSCASGIHCAVDADCGCGLCVHRQCVTRQHHTLSQCGENQACVKAGTQLVCKAIPADLLKEPTYRMDTTVLAEGAMGVSAKTLGDAEQKNLRVLKSFDKAFEKASKTEARLVAKLEQETTMLLAEADADVDVIEAMAAAAQKRAAAHHTGRFYADLGGSTLDVAARTVNPKVIAKIQTKVEKQSKDVRMTARHELWEAKKQSQRRLRKLALTGFTLLNNLNTEMFLSENETMMKLEDKADAKALKSAIEGAELDEDAEVEDMAKTN
ncbi:hypothetical protein MMPV_002435 [Pyropia vietnamensis]